MTEIIDQPIETTSAEILMLQNQAFHGARAREIKSGQDWQWLEQFIFGALNDEAIMVLRNAKTDEERIRAQQMFLACEKPKRQLDFLINQGDAATASLKEIQDNATLENQEQNKGEQNA